jgi:glutamine synthetase
LTVDELRAEVEAGRVEEVVVALPDLQGRLQGSRLGARHFLDHVLDEGFGACAYLLAVDVDMRTGPGYAVDADATGFGDVVLVPDRSTVRRLPWSDATALVLADPVDGAGVPLAVAPRAVLRAQLDRLAAHGLQALAGTELEFLAFRQSYDEAARRRWSRLEPLTRHNVDYALTGLGDLEQLARRIRRAMTELGLQVESARGECHPGQYEVVFRYTEALRACDEHVLYKAGAKELAAREDVALTFMPKFDGGEGNSCHVHLSLRTLDGAPVLAGDGPGGRSALMERFIAGQLACLADFTLLFAPTLNAYKRLRPGSFAPTKVAWGTDNRRCPVRVVGQGPSLRIEHRVPGGDANPHVAVAGIVAAGLHGIEHDLPLPAATRGDPAEGEAPPLPATLGEARDRWLGSEAARAAFGDDVVEHLGRAATAELDAFAQAVTDWERARGFERL